MKPGIVEFGITHPETKFESRCYIVLATSLNQEAGHFFEVKRTESKCR